MTLKLAPGVEIALLQRRIKALERALTLAHSLLLPGQVAVHKSAMRAYHVLNNTVWMRSHGAFCDILRACARAEERSKAKK